MREPRASEARTRLLATATRIFYTEGIHSVGIDRIVAEAQITRATLYRHFPGKEDLVVAYLTEVDQAIRGHVDKVAAAGLPPVEAARAIAHGIADDIRSPGFRGCAFLNAVTEYPDPAHPVHRAVMAHRQWFADTIAELLPAPAARRFVLLRDGAMASGCLTDPAAVCETFLLGVEALLLDRQRTT
ncbi:AcrR family transcriptional regulator [Catenuloplanes nepalensis]|uniref:AcrR family transcriptional regulator n=1 Tax=Catenuloplanes nepalensis TaxID=587533 RepID=A0ABT9MPA6_9ACTN|nr:TetR/AcrR family transcriptional regulator [Catenuloplanes nepalensis]MDP9793255.1 AcrR family transcriptional regulator [Catenuloplanes nepalensis]